VLVIYYDRFLIVEALRQLGYKIGMTGDGVNDAPALKRADVGIAVEGATDAARAAADIVFTKPGLSTIVHGIILSRCIFVRMRSFITYRIAATLQLLVFFFIAVLTLHPGDFHEGWDDFFHLPVLMLMLITLLNDGTLISVGYDNVMPSKTPQLWNLQRTFAISICLAIFACGSSLLLLYLALDSWHTDSVMYKFGLGKITYGQIITMMYLKVSISDFLSLFSSRAHNKFFWKSRPATILMCACAIALTTSTIVAVSWPISAPDGIETEGMGRHEPKSLPLFVWIYSIVWWFIQDTAKVLFYQLLKLMHICQGAKGIQRAIAHLCEFRLIPILHFYRRRDRDHNMTHSTKHASFFLKFNVCLFVCF
jgi:H+-transporting ATPase